MIPGPGVSSGGQVGQLLRKKSSADFDTEWTTFDVYTKTEIDALIAGVSTGGGGVPAGHNHDDRYYTEAEVDSLLASYQQETALLTSIVNLNLAGQAGNYLRVNAAETGFELAILDAAPDTTAPTLTSPIASANGPNSGTIGVTTNEGDGTLYWAVTTSATQPSKAQVKAGQNHTGAAAADAGSIAITTPGAKLDAADGLVTDTAYYAHFMHEDSPGNQSNVLSSAAFTPTVASMSAPVLSWPAGWAMGTNPPEWKSDFTGFETWDSATNSGDEHRLMWRANGGSWTTEAWQPLDDELLAGGFTWPLLEAAKPLPGGLFEAKEQRRRKSAGTVVAQSPESNTISDTIAAPPAGNVHRYWRFRGTAVGNAGPYMTGAMLELSVNGGAGFTDIAAGKTYLASSTAFSLPVGNLFDGNAATGWHSNNTGAPWWVQVDFGPDPANWPEIKAAKWQVRNDNTSYQCPTAGGVDYSDDGGAGGTWTEWWTFTANWSGNPSGTIKEFVKP